jgi:hypothetical protein
MAKIMHLFIAVFLIFTFSTATLGEKKAPLRITKKLPVIDKVKIIKVKPGQLGFEYVISKKKLKGKEAEAFAALWRSQTFLPDSAMCHTPGFAIKLFSKGELIVYASLCWDCNTIEFFTPELSGSFYQGFQGDNKKGQAMLNFLTKALP